MLSIYISHAQDVLDYQFDGSETGKNLTIVLDEIQDKTDYVFYYRGEWLSPYVIKRNYEGNRLSNVLEDVLDETEFDFFLMYPSVLVFLKDISKDVQRKNVLESAISKNKTIGVIRIGDDLVFKESEITISGQIIDANSGEQLPFATIRVNDKQLVVIADELGNYQIKLFPGAHVLQLSYVEYETKVIDLRIFEDGILNLEIEKESELLDEVVIQARVQEIATNRIGQIQLNVSDLKRLPSFLGEPDLIKQIQTLPGVTSVGEAASGFNVRGGSVDQNLILYDEVPVFNSSHVFGFFSSFNSDIIRDISFFRGGIPAEYGGRVSSVLDIQTRDGDYERWSGKAGIGMVTSNFSLNGPLKKNKTSFFYAFRSTYSDWLIHSIRSNYTDLSKSTVSFFDGSIKLSHLFNDRTKLSFSGYASNDGFRLVGDTSYHWHTQVILGRLDHQFTQRLGSRFTVALSNYGYQVDNEEVLTASSLKYRITTGMLKSAFTYQWGFHKLNFGLQFQYHNFQPGQLRPNSQKSITKSINLDNQSAVENALYFSYEWPFSKQLILETGIRLPQFFNLGGGSVYLYEQGKPLSVNTIIDTIQYKKGETIKSYFGIEPRLALRWMTSQNASIKVGYHRVYQYLNLISNTTAVTPVDIWLPSNYYFKPQYADQVSMGYFKETTNKVFSGSSEIYFKSMRSIIDFKDGAQLILNDHIETELLQGVSKSYGIETAFFKNNGRFTGSLSYTFSRTFRKVNGKTDEESINEGKTYRANFDQPHNFNLSWKYNLPRRVFYFTGNFTYHTGRPLTIPVYSFQLEETNVTYFSDRNQYRIPDYHRLDLALIIEGNNKRNKSIEGSWAFSIYNVYARKNPYTIFFKNSSDGVPTPYQLSIIGTVFPSISYNIKFQ